MRDGIHVHLCYPMMILSYNRDCFKWGYPDLLQLVVDNVTGWANIIASDFQDLDKSVAMVLSVTTAAGEEINKICLIKHSQSQSCSDTACNIP